MKKFLNTRLSKLSLLVVIALYLASCTKSDDFLKYLEGGEITYTGKIDSVVVFSGKERVYITGLFMADPKVVKLKVYWNNRGDSIEIPVTRTANVDTLKVSIPINEGVHNFEFITFDAAGNSSLPVFKTGTSYGNRYSSGLLNRPYYNADYFAGDQNTTIIWGGIDLTSGASFTEVEYTNTAGQLVRQRDSIHRSESVLEDYLPGQPLRYRTLFIPDTLSVDTFYTTFSSQIQPKLAYLRNIDFPFQRATYDGSRWGTPAGWEVNAATKNAGGYGGYEVRSGNGALSLEGGWGLPGVTNGKIFQTTNLQPGTYKITISKIERGTAGSVHLAVAEGLMLPDELNLSSSSIAYVNCTGNSAVLEFTLTEAQRVTIGFVGNMPNTGSYFKVSGSILFEVL